MRRRERREKGFEPTSTDKEAGMLSGGVSDHLGVRDLAWTALQTSLIRRVMPGLVSHDMQLHSAFFPQAYACIQC